MRIVSPSAAGAAARAQHILDDLSTTPAKIALVPQKSVVNLKLRDSADPFDYFEEAVENDPTLSVDKSSGKLAVDIFGFSFTDGEVDGPNKSKVTALEYSPIAQRYHVQSTYAGKPNDEFLVNVDRDSKTAQVFQRHHDKKWSDWSFVGRFDAVGRPESDE